MAEDVILTTSKLIHATASLVLLVQHLLFSYNLMWNHAEYKWELSRCD